MVQKVSLGQKIRQLRESKGVTRLELAKALGYESDTAIYLIETGRRGIDSEKLGKVADFFKIRVDQLMGKAEPKGIELRTALRSDSKLTEDDISKIESFIEFLKKQ